jgi:hypothetical protein
VEKEKNDRVFFVMCEYLLSSPQKTPKFTPGFNQQVIYLIARYFGLSGLLVGYVLMISRRSHMSISCFKKTLIFDLDHGHLLQRDEIRKETRRVAIRRQHFPSWQIIKEISTAYRVYRRFKKSPKSDISVSKLATLNDMYLFWLVNFYVYRSIILSNARLIKSEVCCAAASFHPTPEINGCLSMVSDLDIPLIAYISHKVLDWDIYSYSLQFFERVVVKNGRSIDLLVETLNTAVLLEESGQYPTPLLRHKEEPIAAIFLSSFYMLSDIELDIFLTHNFIPCLIDFQNLWKPHKINVYCHPNDLRPQKALEYFDFNVILDEIQVSYRLKDCRVVLAGNTTAIEEVLTAQIPVIYSGKLDYFDYDLMGYVSDGIVLDGTENLPSEEDVARFYSEEKTLINLQRFFHGSVVHPSVRLVDALDIKLSI